MGLFNRHEQDNAPEDEDLDLPTRDDFHAPLVDEPKARNATRYSIDDAMALMRQLPDDPDERLMEVICKTLESARIRTDDVLQDANQKEQRIRREHQGIEQDIAALQKQIDDKQVQLAELSTSLEELTRIKARFEQVRAPQTQAPPAPAEAPLTDSEPLSDSLETTEPATPIAAGRRGRGSLSS
ncbi:hypothetical protein [Marinimicrobium koreense]|jgi:DNA gyrase/topoisomerase IV subunit A|uniref:hypothetical protein n=1 Tax=Marinimicrobium koreense TaxID=306545 RepID=UPI003F7090F6